MRACLGLGGNIGDPAAAIQKALDMIRDRGLGRVVAASSNYQAEPVGIKDQPWFINAAAVVDTELTPREFHAGLVKIEKDLGRPDERVKDGPRPIDIDILLWGTEIIEDETLVVPHPRMHERRFVLAPLSEIAPAVVHPVLGVTVARLLETLHDPSRVERQGTG